MPRDTNELAILPARTRVVKSTKTCLLHLTKAVQWARATTLHVITGAVSPQKHVCTFHIDTGVHVVSLGVFAVYVHHKVAQPSRS